MVQTKEFGIDVSNYQGTPDWKKVMADSHHYKFVFVKATQGSTFLDAHFTSNVSGAVAVGLEVGAYHFFTGVNTAQAKAQADFFASKTHGAKLSRELTLDLETNPGNLSWSALTDLAIEFFKELSAKTGRRYSQLALYTNKEFYDNLDMKRISALGVKIWIARYGVSDPQVSNYEYWQYSEQGHVDGINGYVDLDVELVDIPAPKPSATVAEIKKPVTSKPVAPKPATKITTTTYVVKSGDTLGLLATRFKTDVDTLRKLNHIADADVIQIGEKLTIPTTATRVVLSAAVNPKKYVKVGKGDTASELANKYGSKLSDIKAWNHLDSDYTVYAGETLRVK